jgi:hypothetical protein
MKNVTSVLFMVIILTLSVLVSSCGDKGSEKSTSITKNQIDEQTPTAKSNSFSVGGVVAEGKDTPDDLDVMIAKGKSYLLTQVDNRLMQLGKFKSEVENIIGTTDQERKSLVSELNAEMEMFVALKPDIHKSETKEEVKAVAEKFKAEWLKSKLSVVRAEKQIHAAKENQLISDADTASAGIQKRIELLKASGKDTKANEKLLAEYGKKIAAAKQDVESANQKTLAVANVATDEEKNKLLADKALLSKSAQDNIREAYTLLKEEARQEFSRRYQ